MRVSHSAMPYVDIEPHLASGSIPAAREMPVVLTDALVRVAQPRQRETWVPDKESPWLALRIRPTGNKSFYFHSSGREEFGTWREQIGNAETYTVAEARRKAEWIAARLANGERPTKARPRRNAPFEKAVSEYFRSHPPASSDWFMTVKSLFDRYLIPRFTGHPLPSVRKDQWLLVIELVALEQPGRAINLHKASRAFLTWACRNGLIETNVLAATKPELPPSRSPRFLSVNELAAIFDAAQSLGPPWAAMVGLIILTGKAIKDVRWMDASHIDWDQGAWRIESLPTYDGLDMPDRRVKLPPQAMALLAPYRQWRGLLFPSPRGILNPKPINLHGRIIEEVRNRSGVPNRWGMRDVRRSVARELKRLRGQPASLAVWAQRLEDVRAESTIPTDDMEDVIL